MLEENEKDDHKHNVDLHQIEAEADAVLRLGLMFMAAGTSGYRVIRGMKRTARSLGFDRLDVVVSVNSITCVFYKNGICHTLVATQEPPGVDASRIEAFDTLTHNLPQQITLEELNERLEYICTYVRKRWSPPILIIAAGIACFGFAILNRFSLVESIMALCAASLGQYIRITLNSKHINHFAVIGIAAITASLAYYAELQLLELINYDTQRLGGGFIAAVLFIVPGFPLYSALLDIARSDITAGSSKLVYALSIIIVASISVSMVTWAVGLNPEMINDAELSWWQIIIASCIGIGGFSIIFNSSKRMILTAMVIGSFGNLIRIILVEHNLPAQYAAFIGAFIIGILAGQMKSLIKLPRITITVPAAIIMVPGSAMYRAMYYLNQGEMDKMLSNCTSAAVIILCISGGLAVSRLFTDKDWTFGNPIDFHRYRTERII